MVTKKRRRRELAHARAERQAVRRAHRTKKRVIRQRVVTTVLVVLLLVALTAWILTHKREPEAEAARADYSVPSATTSVLGSTGEPR